MPEPKCPDPLLKLPEQVPAAAVNTDTVDDVERLEEYVAASAVVRAFSL